MTEMMSTVPEKRYSPASGIKTPLGRLGEPRDIAYAYLYLASDEANFVNGANDSGRRRIGPVNLGLAAEASQGGTAMGVKELLP